MFLWFTEKKDTQAPMVLNLKFICKDINSTFESALSPELKNSIYYASRVQGGVEHPILFFQQYKIAYPIN